MLDHALEYAACGMAVFPVNGITDGFCDCGIPECNSPGKHPTFTGGFRSATTDTETITDWWTIKPNANIGIATGAVSGIVVIDVDIGPGKEGLASLAELECRFSPIPKTVTVRTGGGGWHFYLKAPLCDIKNSAGKLARNIDVRGDGGYVIAPPSMHISGNRYNWEGFNA